MERELREYLEGMEERLNARIEGTEERLNTRIDNLHKRVDNAVALIEEVKESLEREVRTISERLGVMSSRVDRMVAASNVVSRLVEWADRQDKIQEESLGRFHSIESRLDKLEKPPEK